MDICRDGLTPGLQQRKKTIGRRAVSDYQLIAGIEAFYGIEIEN